MTVSLAASHSLAGQVAVVTGGARGIGLGIARRLASEGCRVAIWDLSPELLAGADYQPDLALHVDVGSSASVDAACAATAKALGPIAVLVNNAGINGPVKPVAEYSDEEWARVIGIDLSSVFYCCRAVTPGMQQRGRGRVINIASIAGKEGMGGIAAYSAAKAGVIGFTKALSKELVGSGVLVNAIAPVITETDLFREMTAEHIAGAKAKIPLGRFLQVPEIAAMAAFIAGPDCSFTTGFTFDLSGGRATY